MKSVPVPRFQKVDVEPFTQEEIERMLKVCTYSREADTFMRRKFAMRRPTANRDQAIILTLLDSGIRASEFSSLRVGDFDAKRGKLEIRHGVEGGAKGGKGRVVYLGKTARHAVWRYLAEREDGEDANAPLFVVRRNRSFNPDALRHLIKNIAAGLSFTGFIGSTLVLWDTKSYQEMKRLDGYAVSSIEHLQFHPDLVDLLALSDYDTIVLLAPKADEFIVALDLQKNSDSIVGLTFVPNSRTLISASYSGDLIRWNWDINTVYNPFDRGAIDQFLGEEDISSMALSPDGNILAAGGYDGKITLWDINTNSMIEKPLVDPSQGEVIKLMFSPDSKTLLSSDGGTLTMWDVKKGSRLGETVSFIEENDMNAMAFSPDGKTLAFNEGDRSIVLWDIEKNQRIALPNTHSSPVNSLTFSHDGMKLASADMEGTIIIWDRKAHKLIGKGSRGLGI